MRTLWTVVFSVIFAMLGASKTEGRTGDQFVLLKFADQHISVFVLAEHDLSSFRTKGAGAEVVADCGRHTIEISGAGEIAYKSHRIAFSSQGIVIDGKPLPAEGRNFVLSPNGEVREGFVRTFDREPHKK